MRRPRTTAAAIALGLVAALAPAGAGAATGAAQAPAATTPAPGATAPSPATPKTPTATKRSPAATRKRAKKRTAPAKPAKPTPPRTSPGLETIMQDDGLMLFRPADEVQAAAVRMKQLGVDRVRITAYWSSLTRDPDSEMKPEGFDARDPGAYEQARWSALDTAVRAVRAAGMDVLIDIGFWAPHWATDDPPGPRARSNIDPQAYADFATAVALRYSGAFTPPPDPPQTAAAPPAPPAPTQDASLISGLIQPLVPFPVPDPLTNPEPPSTLPPANTGGEVAPTEPLPKVDQFVLWNEPNHQSLLLPQWEPDGTTPASPGVYRAMVRAGYAAVKAVRPSTTVLIGNTSSTGGTPGTGPVPPLEFLRQLACVDANLQPITTGDCANYTQLPGDGWAHHPYSQNERPSRVSDPVKEPGDLRMADLPALAATLNQLVKMGRISPADANIYITEFGYETKGVPGRPNVNETQQARWLTWAEYLADSVPTVRSFAQFLLRDQPPSPTRVSASNARPYGEYSTGLLHVDGSDKIAAKTFDAGLFVQLHRNRKVLFYGRLRLGPGPKLIALQRSIKGGPWKRVEAFEVDGTSAFEGTIAHTPGASYRITYPGPKGPRKSGLAIKPVPITG